MTLDIIAYIPLSGISVTEMFPPVIFDRDRAILWPSRDGEASAIITLGKEGMIQYVVMICYVMLCYVMLCYVMLCYVILYYVMLCYVMLCYVLLCYVMLCHVM